MITSHLPPLDAPQHFARALSSAPASPETTGQAAESPVYRVTVNGVAAEVIHTAAAAIVRPLVAGPAHVVVTHHRRVATAIVRPLRHKIAVDIAGCTLSFRIPGACHLSVEIDGDLAYPLLILAEQETETPEPANTAGVILLLEGTHDAGGLELKSGNVLYLGHGARLQGYIHLRGLKDVSILGSGILDAVAADESGPNNTAILLDNCENILIDGPLAFMRGAWGCIVRRSRNVVIRNLKLVGHEKCSDGIDVDGSHRVKVSRCFIKNNDDCLCIKSAPPAKGASVADIEFSHCTLWNGQAGNGIEFGYESQTDSFRNITFRDIDIIHVESEASGGWIDRLAGLSMHITHDAHVENILFENITLEDVQVPKIIQFTTFHYYREHGWFSPADRLARGKISNVRLRNIHFLKVAEPRIHIEGFNGPDDIENISFENVTVEGINILHRTDLVLEVINTKNLHIE
ncbi:hypothetical protein DB346_15285 [Verrucomicrobia bacterium LW23]|nr:hypothetical protein DB346_15285 [Verrucomicrobia bacterium LW23]